MTHKFGRSLLLLLAFASFTGARDVQAHGSPSRWTAESTDFGCWLTRWLSREGTAPGGDAVVGLQIVVGRIAPPRTGPAQPGLTQAELDGATTVNVRIVDPSLKGAGGIKVLRSGADPIPLMVRPTQGGAEDFDSFYETGTMAESLAAALRAGRVSAVAVLGNDGAEVRFANTDDGLHVGTAMYDACIASKPRR